MGALTEPDQRLGKRRIRMHRDMVGNVVEDVGLRQIVDWSACRIFTVVRNERWRRQSKKTNAGTYPPTPLASNPVRREETVDVKPDAGRDREKGPGVDALQEMFVSVFFPLGLHARIKQPPGFMIVRGVERVRLFDEKEGVIASNNLSHCHVVPSYFLDLR